MSLICWPWLIRRLKNFSFLFSGLNCKILTKYLSLKKNFVPFHHYITLYIHNRKTKYTITKGKKKRRILKAHILNDKKIVKLAYISDDSSKKTIFKKRKNGLLKNELLILCGITTYMIINIPYDFKPEVCPSNSGVQHVVIEFRMQQDIADTTFMTLIVDKDKCNKSR